MKKTALLLAALMLLGALYGCAPSSAPVQEAPAAPAEVPAEPEPSYQYITAEDLKARIDGGEAHTIVDIQPQEYYDLGHIPGSVATHAYPADTEELISRLAAATAQLTDDEDPVIIVGLGGKTGAENAADYYIEQGVAAERLYILQGGAMSWPYEELTWRTLTPQYLSFDEVKKNLDDGVTMKIIDVRVTEEYDEGHLPGAIPTGSFPNRTVEQWAALEPLIEEIEETIDPVLIVCPSGGPGAINAISYYVAQGIDDRKFYILEGGGKTWPYKEVLEVTPAYQYATPEEVKALLEAEEEIFLLSIQTKENYREVGHLPNSIPTYAYPVETSSQRSELRDLTEDIEESGLPVYIMCHDGGAGAENAVSYYVNKQDIPAERFFIIEGGIEGWPYPELLELGR